jgi:hypothetical protein
MYVGMLNRILFLLLASCASQSSEGFDPPPDAGTTSIDAAQPLPDAIVVAPQGCIMGNLPEARTLTLVDNDSLPSALIDELQDMHVGDRRKLFSREYFTPCWAATGTAPTLVVNPAGAGPAIPVWKIPTGQTVSARIPYEPGDRVQTFDIEAFGDGAVDWIGNVVVYTTLGGPTTLTLASNGGGVVNQSAAWTLGGGFAVSGLPGGVALASGGVMKLDIIVSGGTFLHVGAVRLGIRR